MRKVSQLLLDGLANVTHVKVAQLRALLTTLIDHERLLSAYIRVVLAHKLSDTLILLLIRDEVCKMRARKILLHHFLHCRLPEAILHNLGLWYNLDHMILQPDGSCLRLHILDDIVVVNA